jgi:hypothetical protein
VRILIVGTCVPPVRESEVLCANERTLAPAFIKHGPPFPQVHEAQVRKNFLTRFAIECRAEIERLIEANAELRLRNKFLRGRENQIAHCKQIGRKLPDNRA